MDAEAREKNRTQRTLAVWQRRTSRQLSEEDARQIEENSTGFVRVLLEWARADAYGKTSADDSKGEP